MIYDQHFTVIKFGFNVSNDFESRYPTVLFFSFWRRPIRNQSNASSYMNLSQHSAYSWKSWQVRSFFFGRLSHALRNITDELFVFIVGSFALRRHVATKEEKHFTLAINNNQSVQSMCLVTDIPHFPLFIFLPFCSLLLVFVCIQVEAVIDVECG